jgi:hypothetical protein
VIVQQNLTGRRIRDELKHLQVIGIYEFGIAFQAVKHFGAHTRMRVPRDYKRFGSQQAFCGIEDVQQLRPLYNAIIHMPAILRKMGEQRNLFLASDECEQINLMF